MAFPWWLSIVLVLASSFFFNRFYEAALFGFLFDMLYSPTVGYAPSALLGTIVGLTLPVLAESLKRYLLFYNR